MTVETYNSSELKKHIGLIHSDSKLSLLGAKIANALLFHAYKNLLNYDEHRIHIPHLCNMIGFNSKDHRIIKDALISLMSTVLEWNLIEKNESSNKKIWAASSMLSAATIEGAFCTYSYSKQMRKLCYHPEFYGRLNLKITAQFKSAYGLALYENCIRYQGIKNTPWIEMEIYRKLMGIGTGKYLTFTNLVHRVIKPAVKEVNKYANIQVTPEYRKQSGVVIAVRFLITKNFSELLDSKICTEKSSNQLTEKLVNDYGYLTQRATELINLYSESYILDKIKIIESTNSFLNGKIENLASYLEKALEKDYQPSKSSKINSQKLKVQREQKELENRIREKYLEDYEKYITSNLLPIIENHTKKSILKDEFSKYISKTSYATIYKESGFENYLIQDQFTIFMRNFHYKLLNSLPLLSFEDFCRKYDL